MSIESIQILLRAVDNYTAPIKRVMAVTEGFTSNVKKTEDALKGLREKSRALDQLAKSSEKLHATRAAFEAAESKVAALSAKMGAAGQPTAALQRRMDAAKESAERLRDKLSRNTQAVDSFKKAAGMGSISLEAMSKAQSELRQKIEKTTGKLDAQTASMARWEKRRSDMGALAGKLGSIVGWGTGIGLGVGGWLAHSFINTAAEFEKYQATLEVIDGSSATAKASFGWIEKFAIKAPYELGDITKAFVKLKSYGIDPTQGALQSVADATAVMNIPLLQGVEALADTLIGQNARLKEAFGIDADIKGDKIFYRWMENGKPMRAFANKNNQAQIEGVVTGILNRKFQGGADKIAKTWDGMLSNLADYWGKFQRLVMSNGVFDWLKGKLQGVLDTLEQLSNSGQLEAWAKRIATTLVDGLNKAWEGGQRLVQSLGQMEQRLAGIEQVMRRFSNSWAGSMLGMDDPAPVAARPFVTAPRGAISLNARLGPSLLDRRSSGFSPAPMKLDGTLSLVVDLERGTARLRDSQLNQPGLGVRVDAGRTLAGM